MDKAKDIKELWDKYYVITTELLKFINKQDIDEFLHLVDQRTKIFDMLQQFDDQEYRQTEEWKNLAEKIKPMDMQIIYKAKSWLNKSRRKTLTVKSYDLSGQAPLGQVFNKKY